MLPRINRLTKKKDFQAVFQKGKSIKYDFLLCKTLKNNLKKSRFGFIVSKKVSNKAVQRNKIKRRLRKAVLDNLKEIKGSKDVIFIALPPIKEKNFLQIQEVVAKLFKNIN